MNWLGVIAGAANNPDWTRVRFLDCFAPFAMTVSARITVFGLIPCRPRFQPSHKRGATDGENTMRNALLTSGFLALAIGLLWIGQGTGVVAWPQSSFMIRQLQWAGYGAALSAVGLILIWQGKS